MVDTFIAIIEQQGAKHAFTSAFDNSTPTQIKPEGFKKIEDIPCLIIWGEEDKLIPLKPIDYADIFQKSSKHLNAQKYRMQVTHHSLRRQP